MRGRIEAQGKQPNTARNKGETPMKFIRKMLEAIAEPFTMFSILIDEDRLENLDGRYDKYWARRNRKSK